MSENDLEPRPDGPSQQGYLREHRLRLSFLIGLVEGLLVVVGIFPKLALYAIAAIAIAFWFGLARSYRSTLARQSSWVLAASQSMAVLVTILWQVATGLVAVLAVVGIAAAALWFLFAERNRS